MPFKFTWFCELLEDLAKNRYHHLTTSARSQNPDHRIIISWFDKYDNRISRVGPSAIALLSAFFPERRVDRVYNLHEKRLSAIFGRALGLGCGRARELNEWRQGDGADFSICVERVMAQCEFDIPASDHEVTLEEVDEMLHQLAANSPFSSLEVRAQPNHKTADQLLTPIVRRLQSREAKWLVRMLLKLYITTQIPERITLSQFHFMLPQLLSLQNSFEAAVEVLSRTSISALPPRPSREYEQTLLTLVSKDVSPQVGVMVKRQPYFKARSIKHCCQMADKRWMSIERKYDGEYCQVHIDLSKGQKCIQIFSKSGRDSTKDRIGLHGTIKDCLRVGKDDCQIKQRCIIEGELLVWSSCQRTILPFHKIRKYVWHGGRRLGTAADSPVRSDEHLMIALYDVLLLDDNLLLNEPLTQRRKRLQSIVHTSEGRCILGERQLLDFSSANASKTLREAFSKAIAHRWEGFVLKACNDPYFSWHAMTHGIKLKKDYITGLGNSADLCLIGGRRDARVELKLGLGKLKWTSFSIACLSNKYEVSRYNAKPKFKVIDELTYHGMSKDELLDINKLGQFNEASYTSNIPYFDLEFLQPNMSRPTVVFKVPFIIEVMGAGYERPSNCAFYTLRFPRKVGSRVKLHSDRSMAETTSFQELQDMAQESIGPDLSQHLREDELWIQKLLRADGKSDSTQESSEILSPQSLPPRLYHKSRISPKRALCSEPPVFVCADTQRLVEEEQRENQSKQVNLEHFSDSDVRYTRGVKRVNEALQELQQPRTPKRLCPTRTSPVHLQSAVSGPIVLKSTDESCTLPQANDDEENSSLASFVDESIDATDNSGSVVIQACPSPILTTKRAQTSLSMSENLGSLPVIETRKSRTITTTAPQNLPNAAIIGYSRSELACPVNNAGQSIEFNILQVNDRVPSTIVELAATSQEVHVTRNLLDRSAIDRVKTGHSRLKSPIYIAPSVSRSTHFKAKSELYKSLSTMPLPYTHVLDAFLDAMDSTKNTTETSRAKQHHLIFLDFENPQSAKTDLDKLFENLLLRIQGKYQGLENEESNVKLLSSLDASNIMVWDFSVLEHLMKNKSKTSTPDHQLNDPATQSDTDTFATIDMNILATLQHDPVGSELFGGFMRSHKRTWTEKKSLRYYLVKEWDWTRTC